MICCGDFAEGARLRGGLLKDRIDAWEVVHCLAEVEKPRVGRRDNVLAYLPESATSFDESHPSFSAYRVPLRPLATKDRRCVSWLI